MLSYIDFLNYAEQLFNEAKKKETIRQANPYIISCILISFISIEYFINNRLADYASLPEDKFTIHERGFLLEKQVRFISKGANAGKFEIENREEFRPIEDKILFLIVKFGKSKRVDKGTIIWKMFKDIKKMPKLCTVYCKTYNIFVYPSHNALMGVQRVVSQHQQTLNN